MSLLGAVLGGLLRSAARYSHYAPSPLGVRLVGGVYSGEPDKPTWRRFFFRGGVSLGGYNFDICKQFYNFVL